MEPEADVKGEPGGCENPRVRWAGGGLLAGRGGERCPGGAQAEDPQAEDPQACRAPTCA